MQYNCLKFIQIHNHLIFLNQFKTTADLDSDILINHETGVENTDSVSWSAKL